jgi:hypothetical protein
MSGCFPGCIACRDDREFEAQERAEEKRAERERRFDEGFAEYERRLEDDELDRIEAEEATR